MASDEMQRLWQSQQPGASPVDLEAIRRKADSLHSRIRGRNLREAVAGTVGIAALAWFGRQQNDPLGILGAMTLAAGMAYVIWHLLRHGRPHPLPAAYGLNSAVAFHREELARQRDLLRAVPRWYLAPLAPGMALTATSAAARGRWLGAIALTIVCAATFLVISRINRRAAAILNQQIAELSIAEEQ